MNTTLFRSIAAATALFCSVSNLFAAPSITSASGSVTPGGSITVNGSGFGDNGPSIVVFDDFEKGTVGQVVSMTAPIGTWSSGGITPILSSQARSGRASIAIYDAARGDMRQLQTSLGGNQTEVFFSYWMRIPDGTFYPGNGVSGPGMFSTDSSWKHAWLMQDSDGYSNTSKFDMWFPAHAGNGAHNISSNDGFTLTWPGNDWWSWNSWMRVAVWAKGTGGFFQTVSREKGLKTTNFGTSSVFGAAASNTFNRLNFPGWIRSGITDSRVNPVYDDIYVAAGSGAVARIELADASTYAAAHNISVVPVTSWSSNSITARVPAGGVGGGTTWYIYVTDSNGQTNSAGYRLSDCTNCSTPNPPTSVSAQ